MPALQAASGLHGWETKFACGAVAFLIAAGNARWSTAQTRVHRDLGGVTTRVGNVLISSRLDGRVITSVRVGRSSFYNSNYGLTGITYRLSTGRLDAFWYDHIPRAHAWYTPYAPVWTRKPLARQKSRLEMRSRRWYGNRLAPRY